MQQAKLKNDIIFTFVDINTDADNLHDQIKALRGESNPAFEEIARRTGEILVWDNRKDTPFKARNNHVVVQKSFIEGGLIKNFVFTKEEFKELFTIIE